MGTLILVRHAQPVIVPDRPSETWELAQDGRAATAGLARALAEYAPQTILCGDEPKMTGTAAVLSQVLGVAVRRLPGLSEHARRSARFGDTQTFETSIRELFARPGEIVYGEESADMTYLRFAAVVDGMSDDASVIAVSGGTAISIFLARRCGIEAFALWKRLKLPMAFVLDRGTWAITREI